MSAAAIAIQKGNSSLHAMASAMALYKCHASVDDNVKLYVRASSALNYSTIGKLLSPLYMASCSRTVDTVPNTLYKLNRTTNARTPMRCHMRISCPYICRRAAQGKMTQTPFAGKMPTKSPMKATASLRSTTTMPERPRMIACPHKILLVESAVPAA